MIRIEIVDWGLLCDTFSQFFSGLGVVASSDEDMRFAAFPEDIDTVFCIKKNGQCIASMPLHGIQGAIEKVAFDFDANIIRVTGHQLRYVYRVPSTIIGNRHH